MLRRILIFAVILMLIAVVGTATAFELTSKETLGRTIFFDDNLSKPEGQACADCHGAEVGWSGQNPEGFKHAGVYHGAITSRFGNRKPLLLHIQLIAQSSILKMLLQDYLQVVAFLMEEQQVKDSELLLWIKQQSLF